MKKVLYSLILATSLFATNDCGQANNKQEQNNNNVKINYELELINSVIPGTKIAKYEPSEIQGFYKVFIENGQIFYVNPFNKLMIFGEIWTNKGYSITQNDISNWQNELTQINVINKYKTADLTKPAKKITYGQGSKKYEFVIFTDPECPYCKMAEDYFSKQNTDLYVVFKPLEMHPHAKEWSLKLLSSSDLKSSMQDIKNGKIPDVIVTDKAKAEFAAMEELSNKLNVQGTPKIIVIDKLENKIVDSINGADIKKIDTYMKQNN